MKTFPSLRFRIEPLDFEKQWGGKKMFKKVYCSDCKFFNKGWFLRRFLNWLECKLEVVYIDNWEKVKKSYRISPEKKNKNNDCKDYQPRRKRR